MDVKHKVNHEKLLDHKKIFNNFVDFIFSDRVPKLGLGLESYL